MTDMTTFDRNPSSSAERLVTEVFAGRAAEADVPMARLHLETRFRTAREQRRGQQQQRLVRTSIKVAAFVTALFVLGGWASGLELPSWDDGQRITLQLPADFVPAAYPHWVAIFANHAAELGKSGGHSLVVDYKIGSDNSYYLELGLLGVDYSRANEWVRSVMSDVPELSGTPYAITQPLVPYRVSVREMVAFRLFGHSESVERNVVRAWLATGDRPRHIYLIAQPKDYAKRVSALDL